MNKVLFVVRHCEAERQEPEAALSPDARFKLSHGNLMTLLLKHFDDGVGFEPWRGLTTPDVFRVVIDDGGTEMERIWCEVT